MTRYIILTQRPIEGLNELALNLWHMPEIMFKVNARIIKIDGDHDDDRSIKMFIHLAALFGMYVYLYDPYRVTSFIKVLKIEPSSFNYEDVLYYLGGTSHANIEQLAMDNDNSHIQYGRLITMKNGFSQIIEYSYYKYIRFYSADARSTTTIMDVDQYLTNQYLRSTFESLFGASSSVINFTTVPSIPTPH